MSESGQKQTSKHVRPMSALPPKAAGILVLKDLRDIFGDADKDPLASVALVDMLRDFAQLSLALLDRAQQ